MRLRPIPNMWQRRRLSCALLAILVGAGLANCGRDRNFSNIKLEPVPNPPSGIPMFRCDPVSGASCGNQLRAMWLDAEGRRGWAVGDSGVVLHYDGTRWQRDDTASAASGGKDPRAMWLDAEGRRGWAVGVSGVVLHYDGTRWQRDDTASAASGGKQLRAMWLDAEVWIDRLKNFFQRLAQAVENSKHSCLVVSLLATEPEKMNDAIGKAVLDACNQGLNRQASVQSPVEKGDLAELLRRRMFEKFPENPADRHPHVTAFWDRMKAIDQAQAKLPNAEEKLRDAYPFHPDLLARFFGKWTELHQFQRTRGVLQTFAAALREAEKWDNSPIIGPQVFLNAPGNDDLSPR